MAFHLNGYSNFHDDNQDWIVSKIKSIEDTEAHTEELAEAAQASADASQASAEASQLSAEASQASSEASQLSAEASQTSAENAQQSAEDAAQTVAATANQVTLLQSRVDNIIPSGTQTEGNTELLDIRVGEDGSIYESAGDAVRNQIKWNEVDLSTLYGRNVVFPHIKAWIDNSYINDEGEATSATTYHRTDYIEVDPTWYDVEFTNIDPESYDVRYNAWYDAEKNFISMFSTQRNGTIVITPPSNAKYMRLSFNKTTTNTCRAVNFKKIRDEFDDFYNNFENNGLVNFDWNNNIYFFRQGVWGVNPTRVGMQKTHKAVVDMIVSCEPGYKYAIGVFSSATPSVETELTVDGWISTEHQIKAGQYFLINFAKVDDSNITPSDTFGNIHVVAGDIFNANNYVNTSDGLKKSVNTELLGTLTQYQSFLKYNNNYYSTDGSEIVVQDENFDVLNRVSINVGHGNAFQLGNYNYGYVSGWNDNNIYKIDLTNLTIAETIALPTTGYTTGVIDDINDVAYILQRDDSPGTETFYNLIKYDIANENIVQTAKLTKKIAALQSMDLYQNKIYVTYGLGTNAAPSGLFIMDVNGTVLADYTLAIMSTSEPEGVCYDRVNKTLLVSMIDKKLYSIE